MHQNAIHPCANQRQSAGALLEVHLSSNVSNGMEWDGNDYKVHASYNHRERNQNPNPLCFQHSHTRRTATQACCFDSYCIVIMIHIVWNGNRSWQPSKTKPMLVFLKAGSEDNWIHDSCFYFSPDLHPTPAAAGDESLTTAKWRICDLKT